eukprot:5108007-Prymnesium_polylepis.1
MGPMGGRGRGAGTCGVKGRNNPLRVARCEGVVGIERAERLKSGRRSKKANLKKNRTTGADRKTVRHKSEV